MVSPRGSIPFQFTHPGKGATLRSSSSPTGRTSFNSRTLGRVRLSWSITKHNGASVSIHAPWEGCDVVVYLPYCKFTLFQFTHPGKGATDILRFLSSPGLCFNSRTLGRVRPTGPYLRKRFSEFQFTHPGKGATLLGVPVGSRR